MPESRSPTLHDVAVAAGVSAATVSRHRRGVRTFEPQVVARIESAIERLGYRDHPAARSLATGRTGTVGLVVLDLANPHFTSLLHGAHRVAAEHGLSLAFVDTAESRAPERQLVEALARRVDGLIVSARLAGGAVDWIARLGKPVVFFGRLSLPGWHSVSADGVAAARLLGAHLASLGHRRVAYLDFAGSRWSAERRRSLKRVLTAAGGSLQVHAVDAPGAEAGETVAAPVLLQPESTRPTAVVGYNDLIAVGFMHEARRLGFNVPQQVSVAGFDDIEGARHVVPALTTVAMHSAEQGAMAMQRLIEAMAGRLTAPVDETLPPRLVLRDSTRPPAQTQSQSQPSQSPPLFRSLSPSKSPSRRKPAP
ncbi:MAG: LacI family DNA-binding transcriptional regulator [Rubrivivax sp.]